MCVIIGYYFTIEGDGGYLQDAKARGMDLRSLRRLSVLTNPPDLPESDSRGDSSVFSKANNRKRV